MIGKPFYIVNNNTNWEWLSRNPNAISILEKNIDKIDWYWLSVNPNAIHLLEANMDKIDWYNLSMNPNAIHLLSKLDYEKMKNHEFNQELIAYVMNPYRLTRMSKKYDISFEELLEYY